ncbi:hypothetical protein CRX72_29795 [Pantoea sp. BRM17]|nr:hypothetical protein CRX72_29795 [Pantoea sp. BRM17]
MKIAPSSTKLTICCLVSGPPRQRQNAGMYQRKHSLLDEEEQQRLLFEGGYPVLARVAKQKGLPYPQINMQGGIDADASWWSAMQATDLSDKAVDFRAIDYTRPTCILMGQEKTGITADALALADQDIIIPMVGMVQSLNVSVASALILYEAQDNVSAVIRTADAVGIHEVHAVWPSVRMRTMVSASAGSNSWVKVKTHTHITEAVRHLKDRGMQVLATAFIRLTANDRVHLANIMRKIRVMPDVIKVHRNRN